MMTSRGFREEIRGLYGHFMRYPAQACWIQLHVTHRFTNTLKINLQSNILSKGTLKGFMWGKTGEKLHIYTHKNLLKNFQERTLRKKWGLQCQLSPSWKRNQERRNLYRCSSSFFVFLFFYLPWVNLQTDLWGSEDLKESWRSTRAPGGINKAVRKSRVFTFETFGVFLSPPLLSCCKQGP